MLVLNTTSPSISPRAPNARPVKTVPSSSASFAMSIVDLGALPSLQVCDPNLGVQHVTRSSAHASSQVARRRGSGELGRLDGRDFAAIPGPGPGQGGEVQRDR